ncbi:MAG: (2Fe-2S)-binding protein [Pseudomonadota bacterium]
MATTLNINGQDHIVAVEPETPLILVLRNELELYGAKLGCQLEQCGACIVIADGVPIYACTTQVGDMADQALETIGGLAKDNGELHPIQQAFLDENAAQCGYCTAGIIMRAKVLLDSNKNPHREEICQALDGHLCRCGAQPRVIRAIERAVVEMRADP